MFKRICTLVLVAGLAAGCDTAYYGTLENFGVYKSDILKDRVEEAMEAQTDAKEEFQSAFEQFASIVQVEDSALKRTYEDLSEAYEDAAARAQEVTERIDAVEEVSEDLFEEWEAEIEEISSAKLKRSSRDQLSASKKRYAELLRAMRRSESRMPPVLTAFNDQVLYLKHNLNAQAIASLKNELGSIENNVAGLIREMETSIARAQAFIEDMEASGGRS